MRSQLCAIAKLRPLRALALTAILLCLPSFLSAQLNGTYTIGGVGNYATFGAAVTALTGNGISGPVTFNVQNGVYNEQISIPQIAGASAANTVTFKSLSGNPEDVTLHFTPTAADNYIVELNGADYVTFSDLTLSSATGTTYGGVFTILGDANGNSITGNVINGVETSGGSANQYLIYAPNGSSDSTTVNDNTLSDGSYGVVLYGVNTTVPSTGTQIAGNTFTNQGGGYVFLQTHDGARVNGNTGTSVSANRGFELQYCDKALQVQKNRISIGSAYGIYLYFCEGDNGSPFPRGNVSNNMVHVGGNTTAYGIYLSYAGYQDVYFNSVNITSTNVTAGDALRVDGTTTQVNIVNNVLANPGGGYAYVADAGGVAGILTSDYNDLYTTGNYVGYWGSTSYAMLSNFQSASAKDAASRSVYPSFTSTTDLHSVSPWLDGVGSAVAPAVGTDYDGNTRSVPHDIGADAFTAAPSTTTPLSGAYTIGTGGTYATFNLAVADLLLKGVSAAVTFEVLPEVFIERVTIGPVPGASSSNTVTFRSQSGNPADATLYYAAAGAADNSVVKLEGADYIRIRSLTLASNSVANSTYAGVVLISGGVEDFRLDSNAIIGTATTGGSANQYLVFGDNAAWTSRLVTANTFTNGSYGVILYGLSTTVPSSGTQVTGNTFTDQGGGYVFLQSQTGARVNGNTGTSVSANRGFELQYCDGALQVQKNRVSIGSAYGIYLYFCDGGTGLPTPRGNVSNNMVHVGGNTTAYGLYLSNSSYQDVYFNSVNITSTNVTAGEALRVDGTTALVNIVNNVLANPGGGYAYVADAGGVAGILTSDYNDLYTTGNYVGYWGSTSYAMLSNFQSASAKDAASRSVYPSFTSTTDLHSVSPWLDGVGSAVAPAVGTDYDGNTRSVPHDIGADAFTAAPSTTTPLSGTYSIGSGTVAEGSHLADYPTFNAAVADLLLKGVSAAVTFEVLPEVFIERVTIGPVPGASSSNTVTFRSQSGNPADATLYYAAAGAADNSVVKLEGADYIRIRSLTLASNSVANSTYAGVVLISGGVEDFRLDSNAIIGTATTGGSANQYLVFGENAAWTSRLVTANTFTNGSYGVILYGLSTTVPSSGTQVTGNTFTDQGGGYVFLQSQTGARVNGNTGTSVSANRGFELQYCDGALQVQKNRISIGSAYGIYLYFCDGGTGLPTPRGNVSNNMVHVGGNTTAYGLYLSNSSYQDVYFNSVNITSTNVTAGEALRVDGTTALVNIVNNVLANPGGGYAYVADAGGVAGILTSDYNDLYTTGNYVGYWGSTSYAMLSNFQSASAKDAASRSVYPSFTSTTDLHSVSPWLDGVGSAVAPVVGTDYDGNTRSVPHDIGADAFTAAPSTTTPLSGTYSIGAGAVAEGSHLADYPTFNAAVADLLLKGVSGPVVFEAEAGTYTERVSIVPIPGATSSNTVTFQSQSGNPADATLYHAAAGAADNSVVEFNGADYVRFRSLTLASNSVANSTYAGVVRIAGGVEDLRLDSNAIIGTATTGGSANQYLVFGENALWTSRFITGNTFTDGSYGVVLYGLSTTVHSSGTQVTGNTFTDQGGGYVFLQSQDGARVNGNTGTSVSANRGFELQYCDGALQVRKNRISIGSAYGILLYFCDGGTGLPTPRGNLSNNMVHVGGNTTAYGIYLSYATYQDVYFNSVNITSTHATAGQALRVDGTTDKVNVVNNALANSGGGYAFVADAGGVAGIDTTDYNDLYASGTNLAYWNGDMTNLAALQTASGKNGNSLAANPAFYSSTNLHVLNPLLDGSGTPLPSVTDDFDGDARHAGAPDIGADEFSLTVSLTPSMLTGWNMISLPLSVADASKPALYSASVSNAFAYLPPPTGYTARDTFVNGTGYWLKFPASASVSISGIPVLKDTIPLNLGWNLIGTTAYPMPKGAVVQSAGGLVASNYFAFNGVSGYGSSDTLKPGRAYWVKASAPGNIILDVNNAARAIHSPAGDESVADLRAMTPVTFTVPGVEGQGTTLYVGSTGDPAANPGLFELPPVPPEGSFDIRFGSNAFAALLAEGAQEELPVQVRGVSGKLNITVVTAGAGPASSPSLVLIERAGTAITATHSLIEGRPVSVTVDGGKRFSIAELGLPAAYALDQNYPNPFNPTTTVRYSLPVDGVVSLTVFNVLGEVVATPVDRAATPAGYHSLELNASEWPTGAYFCTLRISGGDGTSFSKVVKMLFVK